MSIYRSYTEMLISEEFFYCYVSDDNPRESARGTVQVVKDFWNYINASVSTVCLHACIGTKADVRNLIAACIR